MVSVNKSQQLRELMIRLIEKENSVLPENYLEQIDEILDSNDLALDESIPEWIVSFFANIVAEKQAEKNKFVFKVYKLKKVLGETFTSLKPAVNGQIVELFSTYESRNICCLSSLSKKFIATYLEGQGDVYNFLAELEDILEMKCDDYGEDVTMYF